MHLFLMSPLQKERSNDDRAPDSWHCRPLPPLYSAGTRSGKSSAPSGGSAAPLDRRIPATLSKATSHRILFLHSGQ
jgi:hypothetical protein